MVTRYCHALCQCPASPAQAGRVLSAIPKASAASCSCPTQAPLHPVCALIIRVNLFTTPKEPPHETGRSNDNKKHQMCNRQQTYFSTGFSKSLFLNPPLLSAAWVDRYSCTGSRALGVASEARGLPWGSKRKTGHSIIEDSRDATIGCTFCP